MASSSPRRPLALNIPRLVLWVASAALVGGGYLLMHVYNAKEAAIYTSGQADYAALFTAQSGSTVGGYLVAAGALGALLGVLSLALTWRAPAPAWEAPVAADVVDDESFDDSVDDSFDDEGPQELDAETSEETPVAEDAAAPATR